MTVVVVEIVEGGLTPDIDEETGVVRRTSTEPEDLESDTVEIPERVVRHG